MTEERKVQLGIAVDATDAKAGFDQVRQDARDMAQAVAQAGQAAGKGMDAIGEGAKRSADAMNREEGRMRAAIQRATLDLQTLGKSASEKLEAKINLQGLDAAKFAPYLAALKQAEEAQRRLQESSVATGAAIQRAGMSWNEFTAQRMGPLMKDFTDQGLPHKDAHTAAIRQISAEWQQYKAAGVGAQTAVASQTAAATSAIGAEMTALSRVTTSLGATSFANLDKVGTSLGAAAVKADEAALAVHRMRSEIELTGRLATATTSLGATVGPSARGLRGAIEAAGQTQVDPRLLAASAAQANALAAASGKAAEGQDKLGMSTKQLTFALRQVPMQMTDIVVSLAAGQRPLQVLLQQGGQLKDLFGGIGPAARALGSYALGLVNPFTVAAAAVAGLGFAMAQVESRARGLNTLQAQLAGTGRAGMFTDSGLKEFIAELALAPGVTRESATAIVSELSKVHDVGGGIFKDLGRLAVDYAKVTGTDVPAAAKTLARALADPEKGIKQLDEALGTISSSTILTIERLSKLGDTAGAQRAAIDALNVALRGMSDNAMTPLQRSTNELGNAWERAMQRLDESKGLQSVNARLAEMVKLVAWLIDHSPNLEGIGNVGKAPVIPGAGLLMSAGDLAFDKASALFGGTPAATGSTATGDFARLDRAQYTRANDDEIKRAKEAAKAYRGQAGELADLALERSRFNKALTESVALYGKESEQAKLFRQAIVGVDEKIAQVKKRGAGGHGNEPQQVLDAQLEQRLKASRDILERERDAMGFQQRYLQGVFQAGQLSLVDFYEEKRAAIERGTAAELVELDKERAAVEKHLADTKRTSPKDLSAQEKDRTRLNQIEAQAEKVRLTGSRDIILSDQQKADSLKQLSEQVLNFQASLKQLAGDEAGAARIRAQIVDLQEAELAAQSQRSGSPITADQLATAKKLRDSQNALNEAKDKTSAVNQRLAMEEERIALAQRTGAIGEIEAMQRSGSARAKVAAELEKIVSAQEEIASRAENSQNWQLQLDTSRARLELEKLKADIDPLKEKFDGMFKDAGANFLEDLMNGAKPKDALKSFFGSISREMNSLVAKELSGELFGKNGALGGAGGFMARIFGGKGSADAAARPVVDTSAVTASLANLQAAGADPATAALYRLQAAADAAAGSVGGMQGQGAFERAYGIPAPTTAGEFARFDRSQSGEASIANLFKEADRSGEALAKTNAVTAQSMLQLASAAGRGGNALGLLPSIINAIQAATAGSSAGGGGLLGGIFNLFGSSGGNAGATVATDEALALFFSEGGFTGKKDPRKPAGIVHGEEFVFSAPAVRAIGVDRLERLHNKAKAGQMGDLPGYSDGGYVTVLGTSRPPAIVRRAADAPASSSGGITNHYTTVHVTAAPGVTREQAMNQGRDIQRGMQLQAGRRARNT